MQVWARKGWLTVSFHLPEQTEKFVMGLFRQQSVFIGDKISGIEMQVESIEALKTNLPEGEVVKIKTLTPVVLGLDIEGKQNEQYVLPIHSDYKRVFLHNLIEKYAAIGKKEIKLDDLDFKVLRLHKNKKGNTKTAKQDIKAFTKEKTEVKGYFYDFELTAPREIIEIGLNAGFGSMNSLGFGFGEVVGNKTSVL